MAHIAHLGTGLLGSGMITAARARAPGEALVVWNRSAEKSAKLARLGVRVAASPAQAVTGAARVHLTLSDDAAVDAVLDACASSFAEGVLVVDHTTTSPDGTARRAERLARAGVAFLHAPVFMSPQMAESAKGMMMVAGPTARVEAARPVLAAMTGELWHVGERADLAAAYKLFGNAMLISIVGGLSDVFAMGRALGIDAQSALAVFDRFKPTSAIDVRGAKIAKGDFTPSFELAMARKDVRLMIEVAAKGSAPLAVLPGIAARMDALIAEGLGSFDFGVIAAAHDDAKRLTAVEGQGEGRP